MVSKNQPIVKVRVQGVGVSVFQKEGSDGKPYQTLSLQRSYLNRESGQWVNSGFFYPYNIPNLIQALQDAQEELKKLENKKA